MPKLFQVDAFTNRAFSGNPAAVCLLDEAADANWMQSVAAEMNLAETAFVYPIPDESKQTFHLRWFTPAVEVDLCGHATLATSHTLWQIGLVSDGDDCVFQSASGELRATRQGESIQLDFPATPTVEKTAPPDMVTALGISPVFAGLSKHDWLVEVGSPEIVRGLNPDFDGLRGLGVRGVIVTAADSSGDFDFISRFFAPGAGIDEDPVTGSAHCALGPYWQSKLGKSRFRAWQASARGGEMEVTVSGDRVLLRGHAVTVLQGKLVV